MWAGGGKFDFYYSCLGKVIKNLLIYVMIMQKRLRISPAHCLAVNCVPMVLLRIFLRMCVKPAYEATFLNINS